MPRRRFTIPISIILFLVGTLVGTYLVRKRILERHLAIAMEMGDDEEILSVVNSWPCPANARTRQGLTPLFWATRGGNAAAVERLLRNGAETQVVGSVEMTSGWSTGFSEGTPLHVAAEAGRGDIVELLVRWGADPNAKSPLGTPLDFAICARRTPVLRMLLEAGATPGDGTIRGVPPLGRTQDLAALLLDLGAKVDRRDTQGRTSLHWAALTGEKQYLEFLLEKGADINAPDGEGDTPLHVAARHGREDIAALLLTHGADVSARNRKGQTPLMLAEEKGYKGIADLLRKHGAKE